MSAEPGRVDAIELTLSRGAAAAFESFTRKRVGKSFRLVIGVLEVRRPAIVSPNTAGIIRTHTPKLLSGTFLDAIENASRWPCGSVRGAGSPRWGSRPVRTRRRRG